MSKFRSIINSSLLLEQKQIRFRPQCKYNTVYYNVCVYQRFVSLIGAWLPYFWIVCVCIHYCILVSYHQHKVGIISSLHMLCNAWLAPLMIHLWLLFHKLYSQLEFELTYSTVNCDIRTDRIPHHHPYHYKTVTYALITGTEQWDSYLN